MNFLKSPAFFGMVVVIAIIAAIMLRRKQSKFGGFEDLVKNPSYWKEVDSWVSAVEEEAKEALKSSDQEVAARTHHFVFEVTSSRDAWGEARVLQELGPRTHPAILQLLADPALYTRLVTPTGTNVLPEAPFNRACDVLGENPPSEIVDIAAKYLTAHSSEIRKDAIMVVAKTGVLKIVPHVTEAFGDQDEFVRSAALIGLSWALEGERVSAETASALFEPVMKLLMMGKNGDNAVDVLYKLRSEKAIEFFLSAEIFKADSPIIHDVLETLATKKIRVSRDRLLSLIAELESGQLEYPKAYVLRESFRLLGQHQFPADRELLLSRTDYSDKTVSEGAAEGLICAYGLEDFEKRIWEKEKAQGYKSLSPHQRYYSAIMECDAEINNGGLSQYFVNSSGDHWRDALAGLETMGFKERLAVLRDAVSLFGASSVSEDRDKRQDQLANLFKKNGLAFDSLDSRYYECKEVVRVFTARFVLNHPESFR